MDRMFPPVSPKLPRFLHGGDYNPEQWPPRVWDEDMRLMKLANVNVATVGVFSWVSLQPAPDRWSFDWLDTIMDGLAQNGLYAVLATPGAAHPAWLSQKHPEVLRSDGRGRRRHHGNRVNYCPNSTVYREACATVARKLAERYGDHPALVLWHVSNEYSGNCFCENCAAAFREWLQAKYGSLDELNEKWYTAFWGHTYTDWSQVEPPYEDGEQMPALRLDYARFGSDSLLACYLNEAEVLREVTPDIPVTTNMMGAHYTVNYHDWAPHVDVVSWDCYPSLRGDIAETAFHHDLMAGVKGGERPFLLMEQTPSSQNWQRINALKRPGQMRLWSYLAVAHGADSVMYFQWRRGRGGHEKLHGAVVEHVGHEHTRVFREVSQLGAELQSLDDVVGAGVQARIALIFDWENRWGLDCTSGPIREKKYHETVVKHYRALWSRNVPVHVVGTDADLTGYDIVIAPMFYMVGRGWADRVRQFVESGGRFVATCPTGWVDEYDLAYPGGYPGPLRGVLGIWIEEIDALFEDEANRIVMAGDFGPCGGEYACRRLCDLIHDEGAEVLARFGDAFYAGRPAVTENSLGEGRAYYVATDPEVNFLRSFYTKLCDDCDIEPVLESPEGVEVRRRVQEDAGFLFALNHNAEPSQVRLPEGEHVNMLTGETMRGTVELEGYGVLILQEPA